MITIPPELLQMWDQSGFSVYGLIDLLGGEEGFYDALFSGAIPEPWAMKARNALTPDETILARLSRVEAKLNKLDADFDDTLQCIVDSLTDIIKRLEKLEIKLEKFR